MNERMMAGRPEPLTAYVSLDKSSKEAKVLSEVFRVMQKPGEQCYSVSLNKGFVGDISVTDMSGRQSFTLHFESMTLSGGEPSSNYDIKEVLNAIRVIHAQCKGAKNHEADDFDYGLIQQLDEVAQKVLWHLTRGEEGIPTRLDLSVVPSKEAM